jgi:hypothetical protein
MDRSDGWVPALLTAGAFLAMLSTGILALCDALDGSRWYAHELWLALLSAAAFGSLLRTPVPVTDFDR